MGHQNSFIECVSIIMDGKKAFHVNKGSVGMDEVTFSFFFFFFFFFKKLHKQQNGKKLILTP